MGKIELTIFNPEEDLYRGLDFDAEVEAANAAMEDQIQREELEVMDAKAGRSIEEETGLTIAFALKSLDTVSHVQHSAMTTEAVLTPPQSFGGENDDNPDNGKDFAMAA